VARMREMRNSYRNLVLNYVGRKPLRRPRSMKEDNIRMDLTEIESEGVDWISLSEDKGQWRALVNTKIYLQVP
jgi:hypothetical protein